MSGSVEEVLIAVSIPIGVSLLAAVWASGRAVGPRLRSALQHFAGGLIFAAVAVELLPDIHDREPVAVVLGASAGLALMLGVRAASERLAPGDEAEAGPATLTATIGVDLLIDGLLLGIAFSLGSEQGILLAVGLTVEVLSLALTVAGDLRARGARRLVAAAAPPLLTLLLAAGAVVGVSALGGLSGAAFAAVLGLGSVALLYLVVEELLRDAHRIPDTPWITASFFAGFLLLLLL